MAADDTEAVARVTAEAANIEVMLEKSVATDDATRASHLAAARAAWRSIKRDDLVAELNAESGEG